LKVTDDPLIRPARRACWARDRRYADLQIGTLSATHADLEIGTPNPLLSWNSMTSDRRLIEIK
jgi:hypothetical protein